MGNTWRNSQKDPGSTRPVKFSSYFTQLGTYLSMPAPPPGYYGQQQGPSCFDKMKMGFMMGFGVGCASGLIFGTIGGLRYGLRNMELVQNVAKTMVQGGGTFGTFMTVGTGIRC